MHFQTRAILVAGLLTSKASALGDYVMPWAPSDNVTSHGLLQPSNGAYPPPIKVSDKPRGPILPNTYIVQLKNSGAIIKRGLDPHAEFHRMAKREARLSYTTRQTYADQSLFMGLSLTLDDDTDLGTLKALDNVAGVWSVVEISRPSAAVQAKPLEKMMKRFTSILVAGTNLSIPYITGSFDVNHPHAMSGVDKVHASGIKGKGIKIAVIDTGVDYRHPSLGGCFGEGCKITFGYDFVGNDYLTTVAESPTPLSTCIGGGHGTHVIGIIGMEDQPGTGFGLLGVAPEATLGMYRVFGCSGGAGSDVILSALMKAAADGADVVSMSLGLLNPYEYQDPFFTVTEALGVQGVAVIAATGNDGADGIYSPSAPGTGPSVFAVGSVDNEKFPVTYQLTDSNGRSLRYSAVLPLNSTADGLTVQVMNFGGDDTELLGCYQSFYQEAAANLTVRGIDPSTVILATKNGGCVSWSKGEVAKLYGYNYLLSYTTPDESASLQTYGDIDPEVDYDISPIVTSVGDSTTILSSFGKHPFEYKIFFSDTTYAANSADILSGGFMSNYSSIGPTQELDLKPQLSSPGGWILSTWPLELNGYAVISGTSMATPFMAGCYALVKSQYPSLTPSQIYALLMNSGVPLTWYYDKTILSPAIQQGAGLVNVHNAITWESLVTPPALNLGTSDQVVTANFTIWNRSTRSKTYTLSHRAAGAMQEDINTSDGLVNQVYPFYATAAFDAPSVVVKGGESVMVNVQITPPKDPSSDYRPVYSGFIVASNNYETYTIPYIGQPWDTKTANAIATIAPVYYFPTGQVINELAPSIRPFANYRGSYSFTATPDVTNFTFSMGDYGYMGVLWGTTQIVDYIRFDLVPANTSFTPDLYGFNTSYVPVPFSELKYPTGPNVTFQTIAGLEEVVTVLAEYEGPFDALPAEGFWWRGGSTPGVNYPPVYDFSGSTLPNADYRVVMRVLRQGGAYENATAWESWLSAVVTIDTTTEFHSTPPGTGLGSF